ncbi:Transient receptor putative cation channel sub V member 1 [Nowakowskiella sp. JEL0407]|nr:Transient receptor putative cation channel sub V member 1 [Nowakowskiella sp. JEL0407]
MASPALNFENTKILMNSFTSQVTNYSNSVSGPVKLSVYVPEESPDTTVPAIRPTSTVVTGTSPKRTFTLNIDDTMKVAKLRNTKITPHLENVDTVKASDPIRPPRSFNQGAVNAFRNILGLQIISPIPEEPSTYTIKPGFLHTLSRFTRNFFYYTPLESDDVATPRETPLDEELSTIYINPEVINDDLRAHNPYWYAAYTKDLPSLKLIENVGCKEACKKFKEKFKCDWKLDENYQKVHDCKNEPWTCLYSPGSFGENILHKLVLWLISEPVESEKDKYLKIIEHLLNQEVHRRKLVNSMYEGREFFGETALHMILARNLKKNSSIDENLRTFIDSLGEWRFRETPIDKPLPNRSLTVEEYLIVKLLEYGADPHVARAQGEFFNSESPQYFAGSALGMATRLGDEYTMRVLLKYCKVDPDAADNFGNTPLHILAWYGIHTWEAAIGHDRQNRAGIYNTATVGMKHMDKDLDIAGKRMEGPWLLLLECGAYADHRNHRDQTPLILAIYRKQSEMAALIVEINKLEHWFWAGITGSLYDINALDPPKFTENVVRDWFAIRYNGIKRSIKHRRKSNPMSWIFYIPRIIFVNLFLKRFMEDKKEILHSALEIVAKNQDYHTLLLMPVLQIVLEAKWMTYAKHMFYSYFIFSVLYMLIFTAVVFAIPVGEIGQDLIARRRDFSSDGGVALRVAEIILFLGNLFMLSKKISHFMQIGPSEFFLHGFSPAQNIMQGFRTIGPIVNIFLHVVWEDFFKRFLTIYAVVYLAFSQAIWLQMSTFRSQNPDLKPAPNPNSEFYEKWKTIDLAFLKIWGFQVDPNESQFNALLQAPFPWFTILLYSIYNFTTFVLLINVLIAMLSHTYSKTADNSNRLWLLKWTELILQMDQTMRKDVLMRYRATIGIRIAASDPVTPRVVTQNNPSSKKNAVNPTEPKKEPPDTKKDPEEAVKDDTDGKTKEEKSKEDEKKFDDSELKYQTNGRYFWIDTIRDENLPTYLVTNMDSRLNIGPEILQMASERFSTKAWQQVLDERKMKKIERKMIMSGKRITSR